MAVTNATALTNLSAPSGTSSSSTTGNGQEIAGNFQQFLTLLTTQLKNQSPLDPLDTNQFTQQLVQFASVEQQLKTNATLTTLVAGAKASAASSAAGLVGSTITADGTSAPYQDGAATWTLNAAKAAASATITISDSTGVTVATQSKPLTAGSQPVTWDGRLQNGNKAAAGTYKISVSARDAAGQPVTVSADTTGAVTSVDMSGDTPVLLIGSTRVPLASVKSIGG